MFFTAGSFTIDGGVVGGGIPSSPAVPSSTQSPGPGASQGMGMSQMLAAAQPKITLFPLTAKTVLAAEKGEGDKFKVHGNTTVEEVILVGQIMKMDLTPQSVSIVLCDTTSKVSVEMYSSDDDFKDMMDKLQRLMYVQVVGRLRTKGGKNYVSAGKIRPVSDPDMIALHLIESVHCGLQVTTGEEFSSKSEVASAPTMTTIAPAPTVPPAASPPMSTPATSSGDVTMAEAKKLDFEGLFKQLQNSAGDRGITLDEIKSAGIKHGMSSDEVETAWNNAKEEFMIMPTVDDAHCRWED